jgi:hypothetical protein
VKNSLSTLNPKGLLRARRGGDKLSNLLEFHFLTDPVELLRFVFDYTSES